MVFLATLIAIGLCTLSGYLLVPIIPSIAHLGFFVTLTNWGNSLDRILNTSSYLSVSPILVLIFLLAWIAVVAEQVMRVKLRRTQVLGSPWTINVRVPELDIRITVLCLVVALLLSGYIAYYPSFQATDPSTFGADAQWYYSQLAATKNLSGIPARLTDVPRWPYLVLLLGLRDLFGLSNFHAVEVGPVLLAVMFTASTFLAVREFTGNFTAGLFGAFFSAGSPSVTVGLLEGIYGNWFALTFVTLFFFFLMKSTNSTEWKRWGLGAAASNVIVLVDHPWTWVFLFGSAMLLPVFAFAMKFDLKAKRVILWFVLLPACIIASSFLLLAVLGFVGYLDILRVTLSDPFVSHNLQLSNIVYWQLNLFQTLTAHMGGFLRNTTLLALAAMLPAISEFRKSRASWIMVAWLVPISLITLFTGGDLQWRLLYLLPFSFAAALAACWIIASLSQNSDNPRIMSSLLAILLLVMVLAFGASTVFRIGRGV